MLAVRTDYNRYYDAVEAQGSGDGHPSIGVPRTLGIHRLIYRNLVSHVLF